MRVFVLLFGLAVVGCAAPRALPVVPREASNEPQPQRPKGLQKVDVIDAFRAALPALKACCAKRAKLVHTSWIVQCDGTVTDVAVRELNGTPEGRCVEDVLHGMKLPTQAGDPSPPIRIPFPCD